MYQKIKRKFLGIVLVIVFVIVSSIFYQIFLGGNINSFPLNLFNPNMRTSSSIILSLEEETGRNEKIYVYETGEIIVRAYSYDLKQTIYKTRVIDGDFDLDTTLRIFNLDISNLPAPGEYGENGDSCFSAVYPFFYILTIGGERYSLLLDGCSLLDGFSEGTAEQILAEFIKQARSIDISDWNDWTPNTYKIDFENYGCSGSGDFHESWPEQLQDHSFHRTNYIDGSWVQSGLFELEQHRLRHGAPILSDVCYWIDIDGRKDYYRFDIEPLFPHEEDRVRQEYSIQPYLQN